MKGIKESKPDTKSRGLYFVGSDDALGAYLREIKGIKSLTHAEEMALAERIRLGDKAAIHALVQANLKFVVAVCRNYQYQGLSLEDLINEGNLGLIRAAQRFDACYEHKFISYAVWWVRQSILVALADMSRVMCIAPGRIGIIHRIGRAGRRLEQRLGRPPTIQELSEEAGIREREIHENLQLAAPAISLDAPLPEEEDCRLSDCLEDRQTEKPDTPATRHRLRRRLDGLLADLEPREREIVTLYFGLGRQGKLTLDDIARRFDLTRERARQIRDRALERLRHPSRIRKLSDFQE